MPRLAAFVMIGIAGMFLAPFGMLISKWASMTAFVDSGNLLLVAIICFGSAATAFYWTKWLGKMAAVVAGTENIQQNVHKEEWFVQGTLVVLTILACLAFPIISSYMLVPYLEGVFGGLSSMALSADNMITMCIMVVVVLLLIAFFFGKTKKKIVPIYLAGANEGDDLRFHGAMEKPVPVSLRNWHMESYFGEKKMNVIGCSVTAVTIIIGLGLMIGSLVTILTGGAA